jgi:hypothetical protein
VGTIIRRAPGARGSYKPPRLDRHQYGGPSFTLPQPIGIPCAPSY